MPGARSTALTVLNRCFDSGAWSQQTLNSALAKLDKREASLASRLTLGVLQNYMLLDYRIDALLTGKKKLDLPVRNILRLGAYQILFSDRIPARAAVSESVALCRTCGFSSAGGLVNAVLRKLADGDLSIPEDLSIRYSHPGWFVERMKARFGLPFTEALLAANNTEPSIDRHEAFIPGETYVQDLAAYTAVEMADPQPGMRVLDVCAAPGGKSFTAAVLMKNEGKILSCDIHEKKLSLISEGAERLGISIIETRCADAGRFLPELEKAFDLVIADVPCSGFGVIRKKPEIRMKSYEEIEKLPAVQKRIADNVSRYVVPGGKLLYSTCTVFEEENEMISHSICGFEILQEKTFWPHLDGTDGFYACVLRKLE
ncbi:MAG: methyltransferase domain-containing protein [Oscillospiraceae bacterium]|nr:methyltransferase domain-containing protein [Oscillospiraceae bacterium]